MEFSKESAELTHVKGLGAVQQCDNAGGASPQVVASHLHHQPGALSGAGTSFEAKLQTVSTKPVPPEKDDQIVKQFQKQR